MDADQVLSSVLDSRRRKGLLRSVHNTSTSPTGADFFSNDYLGLARSDELRERIDAKLAEVRKRFRGSGTLPSGSTGSRLLSGTHPLALELEERIAKFHRAESALLFNSGFDANVALFSTVARADDFYVYDEDMHASVHQGMRLSRTKHRHPFAHNSPDALRRTLRRIRSGQLVNEHSTSSRTVTREVSRSSQASSTSSTSSRSLRKLQHTSLIFVAVESVYSMGGEPAPLREFCDVCDEFGAALIVDEAHSTGLYGEQGRGLVNELDLEQRVWARVHTYGKGMGCHGAAIAGSRTLTDFVMNYGSSFIYTTALPPHALISIWCAYDAISESPVHRKKLWENVRTFYALVDDLCSDDVRASLITSPTAVQGIMVRSNQRASDLSRFLCQAGYNVMPIRSPTVPIGTERIRVIIHSHNTREQIRGMLRAVNEWFRKQSKL